eukprot:maker-scaffold_15-snap-gene-9.66-mRNA-1 protein AED:0.04 eAED:0.04 QI:0/0.5/0/1/1/1/5/0/726
MLVGISGARVLEDINSENATLKIVRHWNCMFNFVLISVAVGSGFADGTFSSVEEVRIGFNSFNQAWFFFNDENGNYYSNEGLSESSYNLNHNNKTRTFVKFTESEAFSLVLHAQDERNKISLTAWSISSEGLEPVFHLMPFEHFPKTKQKSKNLNQTSHILHLEPSKDSLLKNFFSSPVKKRILPATKFTNCNEDKPKILEIGVFVDLGYYKSYNSNSEVVQDSIAVILSNVNLIYYFQFHMYLRVRQIIIATENLLNPTNEKICPNQKALNQLSLFDALSQDPTTDSCCLTIDDSDASYLESLKNAISTLTSSTSFTDQVGILELTQNTNERSIKLQNVGYWYGLTDCFPANCNSRACTIGAAYFGRHVCSRGINVAAASRTFQTWLNVAHEQGHGLGAGHSFENGQGETGGIMDYSDGKIRGQYAFNRLRKDELCTTMLTQTSFNQCRNKFFDIEEEECESEVDGTPCFLGDGVENKFSLKGTCSSGECVPEQVLLLVDLNATDSKFYLIEPAEFSPITTFKEAQSGELVLAEPRKACKPLSNGDEVDGNIVLVRRGSCRFTEKALNALNAGASAIVIYNDVNGPPKPIGGEGVIDIYTVAISQSDGRELVSLIQEGETLEAQIGGFPASFENLAIKRISIFEDSTSFYFLTNKSVTLYYTIKLWVEDVNDAIIEHRYKYNRKDDDNETTSKKKRMRRASSQARDASLNYIAKDYNIPRKIHKL